MKKKFFPVALMALAIGFNACSSDDVTVNANGGDKVSFAEGGYVKMAINMPSQSSSRGTNTATDNNGNVNFEDGLPGEYEVKDATLILFEGSDEESAKFHSAYGLDVSMAKEGVQITSTTRIVESVHDDAYKDNNKENSNLYAYVVLNSQNAFTIGNTHKTMSVKINPSDPSSDAKFSLNGATSAENMTFKTFREKVIEGGEASFCSANGFLMNNAPLSNTAGGATAGNVSTLVSLKDHVYRTKAAAEASDANEVFVERAVAKVTMNKYTGDTQLSAKDAVLVAGNTKSKVVSFTVQGWKLDVTNQKSFFGRNYDKTWSTYKNGSKYRFVGSSTLRDNTTSSAGEGGKLYRTYWGKDPNYDKNSANDFNRLTKNDPQIADNKFGANNALYCMENTFDVEEMAKGSNVTRAIVKVQFNGGDTFYTFNGDNTTLYDDGNMKDRVKQTFIDNGHFIAKLKTDFPKDEIGKNDITVNLKTRDNNGVANVSSIVVTKQDRDVNGDLMFESDGSKKMKTVTYQDEASKTLNELLMLGNIHEYVNGLAYYSIPIKHFGNDLTPWDNKTATIGKPYGDPLDVQSYLGRYGVLRNNWYDISISAIRNVGSPVVPETVTPDEVKNYIAVRINVLSWAKRTQVEEL